MNEEVNIYLSDYEEIVFILFVILETCGIRYIVSNRKLITCVWLLTEELGPR